jgi:hypothetical protein
MLLDVIPQLKELSENAEYLFSEKPELEQEIRRGIEQE